MKSMKLLYREFLRQQKICGTVFAIFGVLTLFATLLIYAVSEPNIVMYQLFNPYAYFVMLAGGIAFPIIGFSYQYHRNSSDILHSIPASRKQLFAATAAAVYTWITALLLATYLISTVGYLVMKQPFSLVQGVSEFLNMWIASLTVAAGTMIAVSITGSALSALAASLVVNFIPRLILTLIAVGISSNHMLMFDSLGILSPQYNITFGSWLGLLFSGIFANSSTETTHIYTAHSPVGLPFVYTLILCAVYLFAAVKLFERRKSESAGHASTGRIAQTVVRLGVSSPFIILLGLMGVRWGYEFDEAYFWILLLCAFAINMVYELLSNRSFKKAVKTLPLLLVMTVVLLGGSALSGMLGDAVASRTVDADQIKWVAFDGDNDQMYPTDNEYTNAKYGIIHFDDPQIKALIAENLEETILEYKDPFNYNRNKESMMQMRVKIGAGIGSFTRYIEMPYSDYVEILNLTQTDEQAKERYNAYPRSDELKALHITGNDMSGLTESELEALWNLAVEEYCALSDEEKLAYAASNSGYYYYTNATAEYATSVQKKGENNIGRLNATGTVGGKLYTVSLRINTYLPKTTARLFAYIDNQLKIENLAGFIKEERAKEDGYFNWNITYTDGEGYTFYIHNTENYGIDSSFTEEVQRLVDEGHYADVETAIAKEYNFQFIPEDVSIIDYMIENVRVDRSYDCVVSDDALDELVALFESGNAVDPILSEGYFTLSVDRQTEQGWRSYDTVYFTAVK